ncbi:XRE family transcriptional regulator [Streptomyces sp. ADI98-10]|uniref:XRE family transcriptional regulator n=1 Tax=Streptomyces sp. ADI98-10 TaxID=1522763 RepID=UPI000F557187|nr:XRE family transcriptional regulator [Streptomyces sp. ADI98-10]RPK85044.1 Helix-turn-helix protein [Streptomyces sp. ADI98-10]
MTDHLKDPQAVSWADLVEEFSFTDAEKHRIQKGAQALVLASRVHRLAELRKRQHTTQVQAAEVMGVTQARVSRIEKGQLERSEVDTLAAYVKALGGKLKIVADFGDETYVLG